MEGARDFAKYLYEIGTKVREIALRTGLPFGTIAGWVQREKWRGGRCDLCNETYYRGDGVTLTDSPDYDLYFCSEACRVQWVAEERWVTRK